MTAYKKKQGYFDYRYRVLAHYLERFPDGINFKDKKILEFGCGHGALACTAAKGGAREVLAVDINSRLIEFAKRNQADRFPNTQSVLRFEERDILDGGLSGFDLVLSEATFEHVIGLESHLQAVKGMLVAGGRLYTGYSPLYNSPWGDHRRLKAPLNKFLPWTHLMFPQRWLFRRLSRIEGKQLSTLEDIGLNGLPFVEHERFIKGAGMKVVFFAANNQERLSMKLLEPLRKISFLRELLTFSIYAILEKPATP